MVALRFKSNEILQTWLVTVFEQAWEKWDWRPQDFDFPYNKWLFLSIQK